ncbi:hypothetical protein QSV37_07585 [Acinetobacter sp. VNK23]|uniref:hypothetical protein n=1 Tax=Acinetobacter thutiue TaxID=2998078 RepID=UPI00257749F3|nr:hypothetical protein [Acinetobacter thutiue]MDM1020166.1 hypothetical protein [Acinetobacter thutiue]
MAISGKELIDGLKEVISNLPKKDSINFVEVIKRADKNLKASSNISIETGWFGAWITAFSPHEVDEQNIDVHMVARLERDWDQWKIDLVAAHPSRKHILEEAFRLHEEERYIASIPLFFSQADGICADYFGKNYFSEAGFDEVVKLFSQTQYGDQEHLIAVFKEENKGGVKTVIRRQTSVVTDSDKFPNRHGILHGVKGHMNYGNKTNSLKAYSFLLNISFVISIIEEHSQKGSN